MKRIILIIYFLSGCTYNQTENKVDLNEIDFSNNLSLEEFKIKLEIYTSKSPYPNIDN